MRASRTACLAGAVALLVASGVSAAVAAPVGGDRVAGAMLAQGAGEGGDPDGRDNTDVSELWELYPIDPADAGTPLPTPEPAATDASGSEVSPAAEEPTSDVAGASSEPSGEAPVEVGGGVPAGAERDAAGGGEPTSGPGWVPWLALGAGALVIAGGGAAFAVRRASRPSEDVSSAALEPEPSITSKPSLAAAGPSVRIPTRAGPDREHVRIHLHDGRRIEGWKKSERVSEDNRVIVLDVENVYDSSGREVARTPLDSFVLPPQVDHIESLD